MHSSNHRIGAATRDHRCCHLRHMPAKRCKKESLYICGWRQVNSNGVIFERKLHYCQDHIRTFAEKYNLEIPNIYEIFENLESTPEPVIDSKTYKIA